MLIFTPPIPAALSRVSRAIPYVFRIGPSHGVPRVLSGGFANRLAA